MEIRAFDYVEFPRAKVCVNIYTCKRITKKVVKIYIIIFSVYICRMERRLTPQEAFTDFLEWVKTSGKWDALTKAEKNRIITARRDMEGLRGEKFRLKEGRIAAILGDYGEGRYVPDNGFLINEP